MSVRSFSAQVALGVVLLVAPAQAATVPLLDGVTYALVGGTTYTTAGTLTGSYLAGSGAFSDTFSFIYAPPPALVDVSTTTNNLLSSTFGIDNFTFDWTLSGTGSLLSGPGVFTDLSLPLTTAGTYILTLLGTPRADGGQYTLSLTTSVVPLPPAMLLFGSALVGLGLLRRRGLKAAA